MPPKKSTKKNTAPKKKSLKQTTLLQFDRDGPLQSPPPPSSPLQSQASTSKTIPILSPSKRKRVPAPAQARLQEDSDDSDVGNIKFEPKVDAKPSESKPSSKRRKKVVVDSDDDDHGDEPLVPLDNSQDVATRSRPLRSTSGKGKNRMVVASQSEQEEDEEEPQPRRRRRKLVKAPSDDEYISDGLETEHIIENRLRERGKKTPFQKSLEKLKRKKQGKPIESSGSESQEDESEEDAVPFKGAKPDSERDSLFDEDSDDSARSSDFIVDDEGTAPVPVLPTQFSMDSHQDLGHQFKKIFQFFVHIAVRPAVERHQFMQLQIKNEEYFSVPLAVARRKLSGLRDSLVASSVWRPDFKNALETYPEFELVPMSFAVPDCNACHLGGRMSTLTGRLSSIPYDRLGFEEKFEDSSSSSEHSDSESSDSDNEDKKSKKPVTINFHLGRFCARRTRVYHQFSHWEYHLFKCICREVDELHEADQRDGFVRVAYAGGKQPPEDLQDADGICEWLDERNLIDMEWQKIKDMMEGARNLEMAAKRGADDGD